MCLLPYEGHILTDELIFAAVKTILAAKIYLPNYVRHTANLFAVYTDDNLAFTEGQLEEIIANSEQKHKEAGFAAGWPSRFDTWYKLPMEFGFVSYAMNKPIEISKTGHLLIDAARKTPADEQKIQNVMLNALVKYQTNNPFRKNKSANAPLIMLLQVIKLLRDNNPTSAGIFRDELSFLICWPNNDAGALYKKIIDFRRKHKFGQYTDELIYEECLNIMGYAAKDKNYIKMSKVTSEAVDEYIRKMRSTGIISLRGNGRFIDFNNLEKEKIEYILRTYANYKTYRDKQDFFRYMGQIDLNIIKIRHVKAADENSLRKSALNKYAAYYDRQTIFEEIVNVCQKKSSKDKLLKFIAAPLRFEFLVSIALAQNFTDLEVNPAYIVDDEGLPVCTAPGGLADIICRDKIHQGLIEVTLMRGRQQLTAEIIPVSRHLAEALKKEKNSVAVFIAPTIHDDVKRYIKFIRHDEGLNIKSYTDTEFVVAVTKHKTLDEWIES